MQYIPTINLQEILENPNSLLSDSVKQLKISTDKIPKNNSNVKIILWNENLKD